MNTVKENKVTFNHAVIYEGKYYMAGEEITLEEEVAEETMPEVGEVGEVGETNKNQHKKR